MCCVCVFQFFAGVELSGDLHIISQTIGGGSLNINNPTLSRNNLHIANSMGISVNMGGSPAVVSALHMHSNGSSGSKKRGGALGAPLLDLDMGDSQAATL